MKIIQPSATIETELDGEAILRRIERAGRTCYRSEGKIRSDSARRFVASIIDRGHHSVLEHESVSVRFVCDRGVSHEIVRHRLASYSQESTRYCNYSGDRFGEQISVIHPGPLIWENDYACEAWERAMYLAEENYFELLEAGCKPEMARSVLPNSLKTELVMTANLREWRHFVALRTAKEAHPQLRQITRPLLAEFRQRIPVVFDGVGVVD